MPLPAGLAALPPSLACAPCTLTRGLAAPGGLRPPCRSRQRRRPAHLLRSLPSNPFLPGRLPRCAAAACHQGLRSEAGQHRGSQAAGSASQAEPPATSQAMPPPGAAPPGAAPPGARPKQAQSSALGSTGRSAKRGREDAQGVQTAAGGPMAKVCLVPTSAVGALSSAYPLACHTAYPQPTL